MDDKLIRLARKINAIDNELKELSQVKNFKGLIFVNNELEKYKKFTNDVVNTYENYINIAQKEMSEEISTIKEQGEKLSYEGQENKEDLDRKIDQIKNDLGLIYEKINNSIEKIQDDILKKINAQAKQINNNKAIKDKELSEITKENLILKTNIKDLKEMFEKLELQKGDTGKSAYDIACELGFKGTAEEWIKSLHGKDGKDIELRGMRAFSDAPKDNKTYGRKNKKWVQITGDGSGGTSDYDDLSNKPKINNVELSGNKSLNDLGIDIPSDLSELNDDTTHRLVTDTEKETWNDKGTYSKPSGGIPKTDLASSVQTSLGKANTALQSYTEQYTGTITGIKMNGSSKGTSGVVDLGTVITSHQDISGKENTSNKVTSISSSSTNTQYPSAKCVYDYIEDSGFLSFTVLDEWTE